MVRSATGEAWQEIMLDCINKPQAKCDPKSDDKGNDAQFMYCSLDLRNVKKKNSMPKVVIFFTVHK